MKHTADENQIKMLNCYIDFLESGDYKKYEEYQKSRQNITSIIDVFFGWCDSHEMRRRSIV